MKAFKPTDKIEQKLDGNRTLKKNMIKEVSGLLIRINHQQN